MSSLTDAFGSSDSAAQDYLKQALQYYSGINTPTAESMTIDNLPQQTVQGVVNPDSIAVAEQAPTAYNNISLDPTTRAAQMAALGEYSNIANTGGLDANAKLAIQQANDAATRQSQGEQGAIMKSAQAMGQGGGDFALTQRALAAQGASNTGATNGMQAAAMAEANREAALNAMSNIGGGINAADYSQAAQKAASENTINATNAAARNTANTGNVTNKIQTGEFNTGTAQNVNAANTGAKQGQVYYNAGLPQQQFNDELAKANGMAGIGNAQAGAAQSAANANAAFVGSLLGAGGQMGGSMGGGSKTASMAAAHGAVVPEKKEYTCYADGGVAHDHAICMKLGGHVPGEAKVEGDSKENDTVDAKLSPGELVIPRSVPKDGPHMEEFAKHAPVGGDTKKKVDLTSFTSGYKRSH